MIEDWKSYRFTKYRIRFFFAFMLGLLGIAASVATIYALPLEGAEILSCGIEKLSCTTALTSPFAKIFGIPLGIFGVLYFTFWTLNLRAFQMSSNDGYIWFLSWITLLGALGSLALAIIMFVILRAPCLYCLITHLSNIGAFILLWPVKKWKMETPFTVEQFRHFSAISAIAVLAAIALYFANDVRQLQATLAVREEAIDKVLGLNSSSGKLTEHSTYSDSRKEAVARKILVCVGFFDPG